MYISYELWSNPKEYLRKRRARRAKANRSWFSFLFRGSRVYDEDPERELREGKFLFVFLYVSILVWFILIVTGNMPAS